LWLGEVEGHLLDRGSVGCLDGDLHFILKNTCEKLIFMLGNCTRIKWHLSINLSFDSR
jgi:hypothetical protein